MNLSKVGTVVDQVAYEWKLELPDNLHGVFLT
jgi:hypothetical protein